MTDVYSISGKKVATLKLPTVFETVARPDLVQRSVVSLQSCRRQSYGVSPSAGLLTSADYFGRRGRFRTTINRAMSRLPREKTGGGGLGKVRKVPQAVGGRRAHPPKNKDYSKNINRKEGLLALKSAIASTSENAIVLEDTIEKISKTKELSNVISALKLKPGNILLVVGSDDGVIAACNNLEGVNCTLLSDIDVEKLVPTVENIRQVLWSKSAIDALEQDGWQ